MNCECGLEMKTGDELCPRCGKSHDGQWSAPPFNGGRHDSPGVDAIQDALQDALQDAYSNAGLVCCGRGGEECCGCPEPEWDATDQAIMDTLGPIEKQLREAIIPQPRKEDCEIA